MSQNELLTYYNDPRVRAILGVIRDAEGTARYADPYRVAGGGKVTLSSLNTPTFHLWNFTDKTGKQDKSSATGAYQFLRNTWGGLQNRYGFTDFSPRTQDLAAIALLKDAGAMPYIQRGDYLGALNSAKRIWASLPGAGYNQAERSLAYLKKSLEKHLGHPVAMHTQTYDQPTQPTYQEPSQQGVTVNDISPQPTDPYAKLFNIEPVGLGTEDMQPIGQLESGNNQDHNPFLFSL